MADAAAPIGLPSSPPTQGPIAGRTVSNWLASAVVPALVILALWFRVGVSVSPIHETTVGTLWPYDYRPAVNAAAGYGFVQNAPPDRYRLTPVSAPIPLVELARTFEPVSMPQVPYPTTLRVPGYSAASMLAMMLPPGLQAGRQLPQPAELASGLRRLSLPLQVLSRRGVPALVADTPPGTSSELFYRRGRTEPWRSTGWTDEFFDDLVQFQIVLRASPDRRRTPTVTQIRLVER